MFDFKELEAFVWVSETASWQLDGNLYDRDGRLLYVELKGACSATAFAQLRSALGAPPGVIMIQLLRQAVFLSEAEFERLAFAGESQ